MSEEVSCTLHYLSIEKYSSKAQTVERHLPDIKSLLELAFTINRNHLKESPTLWVNMQVNICSPLTIIRVTIPSKVLPYWKNSSKWAANVATTQNNHIIPSIYQHTLPSFPPWYNSSRLKASEHNLRYVHWSQNKENLKELGMNKNTYLEKAIIKMEAYKPAIWIYNANLRRKKKLLNPLGNGSNTWFLKPILRCSINSFSWC